MESQPKEFAALWYRQRVEVRFCLLFAMFFALLYWFLMRAHGAEAAWTIENIVTQSEIRVCGQILAFFGIATQIEGTVVRTAHFGVRVLSGCNGMETVLLYSQRDCSAGRIRSYPDRQYRPHPWVVDDWPVLADAVSRRACVLGPRVDDLFGGDDVVLVD
jgi:hypothetical protein